MPSFDDISHHVAARVEGCPHGFVVEALRDTAIDFCVRTRFHTTGHQLVLDGAEDPGFDLEEQVIDIVDASVEGSDACVHVMYLNDPLADDLGANEYALRFTDPNEFELLPAPTLAAPVTLNLLVCLAPGPDAAGIHDDLWRRHHETLKNGALARLFAESKKVWGDPAEATRRLALYENAVTKAAAEAGRNRTQPARRLRVKPA
jgi:hypothetical protein